MAGDTHYDVLGIEQSAKTPRIRKAYVAQARLHHPDFHVDDDELVRRDAEAQMRLVNEAWAILGRRDRRERYDRELTSAGNVPGAAAAPMRGRQRTRGGVEEDRTSGSAPPRWLTVVPVLCLVLAFFSFVVGFLTGLTAILASGLFFAIGGAVMFVVAPVVAMNRSKRLSPEV